MRDGFIFYGSFWDALSDLPDEQRLEAYDAICAYALTGEEPQLSGITSAVFKLIKPQLDANARRRESGKQGGRPKKGTSEKPAENQTETKDEPNENQIETKEEPKEKDKGKDKAKDKAKEGDTARARHRYGKYAHVLLSDHDLTTLDAEYGHDKVRAAIQVLDNYCETSGKTYKNYAQALRNWAFRALQEQRARDPTKPAGAFFQFEQNHYSAEELAELVNG